MRAIEHIEHTLNKQFSLRVGRTFSTTFLLLFFCLLCLSEFTIPTVELHSVCRQLD